MLLTSKDQNEHEVACSKKLCRLNYETNIKINISIGLVDKWHLSYGCNILELLKNKICGVATDEANIMKDVRSGFTTYIKNDVPQCITIHYILHKLALVSSQAAV